MEIFILLVKIIFTLFFVGYGLTAIFIPEKLRRYGFWLSPWFGMIFICVIGVLTSLSGLPMYQIKFIIIALSIGLFFYALITRKKLPFISKENFVIGFLMTICVFFNLYPMLVKAGFPTTMSLGNLDPLSYTATSDFLVNHTLREGGLFEHYKPYLWATGDLFHSSFRWGTPMVLSFFSSLLAMRSYQIYSILITLFFALSFPIAYILAKLIIQKSKSYWLLFFIFLTQAFNSTSLYMLYNVFFAQFAFIGVFITVVILLYSYFSDKDKLIKFNSYDFLIAFCLSSLTTLYLEGLFFIFIPVLIFVFLSFLQKKYWFILYLGKIILLLLLINPTSFSNAIIVNYRIFLSMATPSKIGWENIRYSTPIEMMGFYNLYYSRPIPILINIFSSLGIVFVMIIGFFRSKQKLLIGSFIGFFILLYLAFALFFKNFFTYHRAVTYTLFFLSVLFSCGMLPIVNLFKNKLIKLIIIIFFIFLSLRSSYRTIYQMYWHPRIVDQALISLDMLNSNKKINTTFYTSDVFLGEYDLWKRLWREYFLMNKLIVTRQNYSTEKNFLKGIDLVLTEKSYTVGEGKTIIYKNTIWESKYYQLGEIAPIKVAKDLQKI